jgi:hypothetical protein
MHTQLGPENGKTHEYALSTNIGRTRSRLGWISASTGVTYCGICLRAPITPQMGSICVMCGAQVTRVFDLVGRRPADGGWLMAGETSRTF